MIAADQTGHNPGGQLHVLVCYPHELRSRYDMWSCRLFRELYENPADVCVLIRRVTTTLPKLPHLDLRSVSNEKQQPVKQLLGYLSAQMAGLLVRYQVVMRDLTKYAYLSHHMLASKLMN